MKLWGYDVPVNSARCPRTVEVCARVPSVHSVLFSILDPHSTIPRHRGWAPGVVRLHYPLIVPRDWRRCRIEAVLIVDFEPLMSPPLEVFMRLRYTIVRRSEEIRTICDRAAVPMRCETRAWSVACPPVPDQSAA